MLQEIFGNYIVLDKEKNLVSVDSVVSKAKLSLLESNSFIRFSIIRPVSIATFSVETVKDLLLFRQH